MPTIPITISLEPSGRVSATGADELAAALLKHAGFTQTNNRYGRRHLLAHTTAGQGRAAIATHAAQMLRTARYFVELDPALDATTTTPTDPQGLRLVGGQVLQLTDQIRGATTTAEAAHVLDQLLDPTDGVLIRLQEALEAAADITEELDTGDGNAWQLADRFTAASDQLVAISEDLLGAADELRDLDSFAPARQISNQDQATTIHATATTTSAARATSPTTATPSLRPNSPPTTGITAHTQPPLPRSTHR